MKLLVSGATATIRAQADKRHLGHLITPRCGNSIETLLKTGLPISADNDAFVGFSPARFCAMLARLAGKPVLWVACPDVVGDASATAERFAVWRPVIAELGLPVALVLQDGQEHVGVPWDKIDALFIGGSTEFKLGPVTANIVREGKRRGMKIHGGRVNTKQRFRFMHDLGCDTIDGSGFSKWGRERIPMAVEWLDQLDRQGSLLAA